MVNIELALSHKLKVCSQVPQQWGLFDLYVHTWPMAPYNIGQRSVGE